jgi:hypothetical protein
LNLVPEIELAVAIDALGERTLVTDGGNEDEVLIRETVYEEVGCVVHESMMGPVGLNVNTSAENNHGLASKRL